jgi:hypothetical protein
METKDKKDVVNYIIQVAEELGFEFIDEEKYDYYFKFI